MNMSANHILSVPEQVSRLIEPILEEMGFELVDAEYMATHGRWVLRIYIDKSGGVTIDDCAMVSYELGDLIDIKDIVRHEYVLEVSSPGVNRPLKKEKDFMQAQGKKVKIRMITPVNGRRNFSGLLHEYQEGTLFLEGEDGITWLSVENIEKANLIYEFQH